MNIVDSSGWLAYFADEPNAKHFITPLHDTASLVIPSVKIYEVFKVVLRETSENEALQAAAAIQKGKVLDLTAMLSIAASRLSLEHGIPMAESIKWKRHKIKEGPTLRHIADSYSVSVSSLKRLNNFRSHSIRACK